MQRCALFLIPRLNWETTLFKICQTVCLVALSSHMQHINTFICLDSKISLISHQQLDKLNIAMKWCKVQRIEPLLRLGWCIYPICDASTHFLFYILNHVKGELVRTCHPITLHLLIFQVLRHALFVVGDEELTDAESIVVCSPMQQIMSILVHYFRDREGVL